MSDKNDQRVSARPAESVAERLVPAAEIASLLSLSERTLWRWVSAGQFPNPCFRRGPKLVRWRASRVQAWIEENTQSGQASTAGGLR